MVSKRVNLFIFAATLILSMTFMVSAITGTIGNGKMILYPEVGYGGVTISKTILVNNSNNISVNVSLKADGNFSDMIEIIDQNFILQAGEEKKAQFNINVKRAGDYNGKIYVFFSPIEEKGPGIALSSNIIIHATESGSNSDDNQDDNVDESDNTDSVAEDSVSLGNFVSDNKNKGLIIGSVSTLVLFALLIVLLVLNRKKEKAGKDVKRKSIKRSDRSS